MSDNYKKYAMDYSNLAALLKKANLAPSSFSPLSASDVAAKLSADARLTIDPSHENVLTTILTTIAQPDKILHLRFGGGQAPMAEQWICLKDNKIPTSLIFQTDQVYLYQYPDTKAIVDLFVNKYASRNDVTVPNLIPPMTELSEFIFILHGIDMYRRHLYQNLLEYAPGRYPQFSANIFIKTFTDMLAGKDIRWLAPSFLFMIPDFDFTGIDISTNSLKGLIDTRICIPVLIGEKKIRGLKFSEEGLALGAEFERSWYNSIAFSLTRLIDGQVQVLENGYIAPTASTNHFVTIGMKDGKAYANHQAFRYNQMHKRLQEVLDL